MTSDQRITHIECADPGDEQAERTSSAARHEHEWIAIGGSRWRLLFDRGAWVVQMFVRSHGYWQTFMVPAEVTFELARLAGLTPPEER
jgi:hypothetical protein